MPFFLGLENQNTVGLRLAGKLHCRVFGTELTL